MDDSQRASVRTLTSSIDTAAPSFFATEPGEPGLAMFLNAGDPPLDVLRDVVHMLDDCKVDCLELAVPFPNSVTDGPVIQRSARRALGYGVGLDEVLDFLHTVRPGLKHLKIALLADWSHTVKPMPLPDFLNRARESGSDALLVHGLPPKLRPGYYEATRRLGLPIVTTCYASSAATVLAEAGRHASAYLYLVAHYGRTGTAPETGYQALSSVLTTLRTLTEAPIAVGFGVATRADVEALRGVGADAAIVGSAGVSRVERALTDGQDVVGVLHEFLSDLRPHLAHPAANIASPTTPTGGLTR